MQAKLQGRDGGLEGGEQSFLKLIASANRNKCRIKTIGLVKTTPLYLSSQAPTKILIKQLRCQARQSSPKQLQLARSHKPMHLVLQANRGAPTQTSDAKLTISSLAMLNSKATQAKLESSNYLATQTKQCNQHGYTKPTSYARELLLCYTSMEGNQ